MHHTNKVILAGGLLGLLMSAGCGGGGSTTTGGGGDGTTGSDAVTTASGTTITQAAQDDWAEGIAAYNAAIPDGWTPAECQSVIHLFDEANSTQGGRFTEAVY